MRASDVGDSSLNDQRVERELCRGARMHRRKDFGSYVLTSIKNFGTIIATPIFDFGRGPLRGDPFKP